jgi:hypothetical protein
MSKQTRPNQKEKGKENLDEYKVPPEPRGKVDFQITELITEDKEGNKIYSKFSGRPQIGIVCIKDGFEFADWADLPKDKFITPKIKLGRIMNFASAKSIPELKGKWVQCAKVFIPQTNVEKWRIIGRPELHSNNGSSSQEAKEEKEKKKEPTFQHNEAVAEKDQTSILDKAFRSS